RPVPQPGAMAEWPEPTATSPVDSVVKLEGADSSVTSSRTSVVSGVVSVTVLLGSSVWQGGVAGHALPAPPGGWRRERAAERRAGRRRASRVAGAWTDAW